MPTPSIGSLVRLQVSGLEPSEHLFRRLLGAYLRGAAVIEVTEPPRVTRETRKVVEAFCRRTERPVVVSDDGRTLRLRENGTDTGIPPEGRLRRLGERVVLLHRNAVEQWTKLPLRDEGLWERLDDDVDRDAWFLQRSLRLNPADSASGPRAVGLWAMAHALERAGDYGVILGEAGPRLAQLGSGSTVLLELRQLHEQAVAFLEETLRVSSESDANERLDVAEALLASRRALSEWLQPAVGGGSISPAAAVAVERVLSAIEGTVRHGQEIAQVVLDGTLLDSGPTPRTARAETSLEA